MGTAMSAAGRTTPSSRSFKQEILNARVRDPSRNTRTQHRWARLFREARRKTARRHPRHDPRIGRVILRLPTETQMPTWAQTLRPRHECPRGRRRTKAAMTTVIDTSRAVWAPRCRPQDARRPHRDPSNRMILNARVRDPSRDTRTPHRWARLFREARRKTARRHPRHDPRIGRVILKLPTKTQMPSGRRHCDRDTSAHVGADAAMDKGRDDHCHRYLSCSMGAAMSAARRTTPSSRSLQTG